MPNDDRDLLELLQDELRFIEQGGYGRSVRTPWKEKSTFQDSLTCLNYGYPYRAHPCGDCHLIEFVAPEDRNTEVPCHHIALNSEGLTIEECENLDDQRKLENEVKEWLRTKINELQEKKAKSQNEQGAAPGSSESIYCCKT